MTLYYSKKLVPDQVTDLIKIPQKEVKYGKTKSILSTEVIEYQ
jgi:hypothetical protein